MCRCFARLFQDDFSQAEIKLYEKIFDTEAGTHLITIVDNAECIIEAEFSRPAVQPKPLI